MPFPTKTVLALVGVGAAASVAFGVMRGGEEPAPVVASVAVEDTATAPAGPLLSYTRPDGSIFEVMGPVCYEDTRGNDVAVHPSDLTQTDCYVLKNGGRDLLDLSRKNGEPVFIRVVGQRDSYQSFVLGPGDHVIEVDGTTNMRISGGAGANTVLALPNLTTVDLRFRQQGDDVLVETPRGTLVLARQTGTSNQGPVGSILLRGGVVLERSQITVQSVVGQGTPGDDLIRGTDGDDVIYPGLGNDRITLLGGRNRVHYEGGNDRVNSSGAADSHNTLYIPFLREEVIIRPSDDGRDILVETPLGIAQMELQLFYPVGDKRVPIQSLVFVDGPIDEATIRALADTFEGNVAAEGATERSRVRN